ncbi:MAG: diguanylate cyclase (GGDEF)-like protein [Candidatus Paceibacteria bacterium]|jgi:diguanylate cyclase (GGDEF)-like protein
MKVLLVEDSLASSQVTQGYVESAGHSVITARDGNEGIQKFLEHKPDLVLLDVNMPNMDGYECAQHIRKNCQQGNLWIPIIFLSGEVTEDAIVKGIDAGGDDYLPKPITQRVLSAKLRAMSRIADMRKELEDASEHLKRLSSIDGLTQLYNRRHFDEALKQEWSRSGRSQDPLSLILCDIDHFKAFNDCYGHLAGDDALVKTSQSIMDTLQRPSDLPARYGGEEFAVILPNTPAVGAMMVAEQLRTAIDLLAIPHALSDSANIVTMSIGVSTYYPNHSKASHIELLDAADRGLYRAKKKGRNRIELQPLPSITLQRQQSLG